MTPHNNAKKGDISNIVIMPGDPKRAKFIAENYLTDYKLVNDVRCAYCYTGFYKGKKVSIMASGMGMPSISIYAYELFSFYDVDTIIRLGSCQSRNKCADLGDIILASEAYTDSNIAYCFSGKERSNLFPSTLLNNKIKNAAKSIDLNLNEGPIITSDLFYKTKEEEFDNRYIGLEMETFALFLLAETLNKNAASILTVSDTNYSDDILSAQDREKSFDKAIKLALESIL